MFANSKGNSFWTMTQRGGFAPERTPDPAPPAGVLVDGAPLPPRSGQTGSGPGMKIGAGGKPQGYDAHGQYTGPNGGAVSLRDGSRRLLANGPEGAGGWLNGGNEVRGPVTPPQEDSPYPPPPPAPKEPHLTYSQESGALNGPDGKPLAYGYAGQGGGQNNPGAEGIKGVGPIPQGNWRVEDNRTDKWPPPSYKLTPDAQTRERVKALGRDPDSFYLHAKARLPQDRGRDSAGCIALDMPERMALGKYSGRWLRVEK